MDQTNPFASPITSDTTASRPKRPVSPMVIGIISIVFAGFGALGSAISILMFLFMDPREFTPRGFTTGYLVFSTVVGFLFAFWLLAAGIGLVRYCNWGRISFNVYAVITIVWTVAQSTYMLVNILGTEIADPGQKMGMIGGTVGGLLGLIFPIVGLVLLNLRSVRNSLT